MSTDPLLGLPEQERLLFDAFRKVSAGKNVDAVLGAAVNIVINAIRQMEALRAGAEGRYDALFGRGKTLLLDRHYDSVTGKRRTVFPFTQVVKAAYHEEDDLIRG
jgi:predicted ATPase